MGRGVCRVVRAVRAGGHSIRQQVFQWRDLAIVLVELELPSRGVDFDRSSEAFILSSLNGAGVVKLSIDDIDHQNDVGSIRNWATGSDARDVLVSTTGVRHDRSRGLTFVCNS